MGYDFDFSYMAATQTLGLSLDGTSISTMAFGNIGDATDLYIRLTARDETPDVESVVVSDLMFNGGGAMGSVSSEDGARTYAVLSDADFAADWSFTGTITLIGPFDSGGSNYAAQFKLVDASAIPLPAAGWLMLAGIGALGLGSRRRGMSA